MTLTGSEDLATAIAAGGKLGIVAIATVDLVCLRPELFVHKWHAALAAQETGLMPVLVFVGKILKQQQQKKSIFRLRPDHPARRSPLGSATLRSDRRFFALSGCAVASVIIS